MSRWSDRRLVDVRIALMACALLSACRGGGTEQASQAPTSPPPTTVPQPSVSEAVVAAESSGRVPMLNRDSTVAGPDSDRNGVRDDIDQYIAALADSTVQKRALAQQAAAIGGALTVDTTNASALLTTSTALMNGTLCLHAVYAPEQASRRGRDLEKMTANTMTRLQAYEKFNSAMSGTTTKLQEGGGCAQ